MIATNRLIHRVVIISCALMFFLVPAVQASDKPNIVVILADDLGNADLGYRGSQIRTPNIDALANEGVRLESFYGMPLCTSARAAFMTGRYPMRTGLQTFVIFPGHTYGLPTEETTLPQALKRDGYKTVMVGKWHLGHADRKYWPQNRGFDHFYGNLVGEVDYFTKDRGGVIDWQRNGQFLKEDGYHTIQIGDEAVKLIEEHDTAEPLFLYFAALAPHSPYEAPQSEIDAYSDIFKDKTKRIYAAMITVLDTQVGRIIDALEKKGMRDNTLIFFASDNGGKLAGSVTAPGTGASQTPPASNGKFRDGKASLYEGGVRVPAIVNWPGKLKPGITNEPLHLVDLMPTFLGLAGDTEKPKRPFDGKDVWASFEQGKPSPHEDILVNVEFYRGAIRKGQWKLVKMATLPGKTELFDMSKDPGEKTNVADQFPQVVADLEARLIAYAREQKPSEWLKAQRSFLGVQGKTVFDPGLYIDDDGLPHEKMPNPAVKQTINHGKQ